MPTGISDAPKSVTGHGGVLTSDSGDKNALEKAHGTFKAVKNLVDMDTFNSAVDDAASKAWNSRKKGSTEYKHTGDTRGEAFKNSAGSVMKGALQSGAIVADFCMGIPDLILGRGGNEKPDDSQVKMGLDIGLAGAAGRGVTMGTGFLAGGTGGAIGTGVGAPASLGINGLEGRKINSDNTKQKIGVVSDLGTKAGTLLAQGTGGLLAGVITVARFVPAAGKVAVIGVFGLVGAVISPFAGAVSALAHKAKK